MPNALTDRLRAWTYRRQRLAQTASTLEDALADVFAVYSAHPSAPLSLWARADAMSAEAFAALERERRAVRVAAMRSSIFLLRAEDAVITFSALPSAPRLTPSTLKYIGIQPEDYPVLKAKVIEAAEEPLLAAELRAAVGESEERIASIARLAALEGDILRIGAEGLRSNSIRYVSTRAWLPALLDRIDAGEAQTALARRYFAAFGPARVRDFQWWTGLPAPTASAAVERLPLVDVGGKLLLPQEDRDAFETVEPLADDALDILPKWDSLTMGYAPDGRARFLAPEHQPRVYLNSGDGLGVVLLGGRAVAAWNSSFSGRRMDITLDVFDADAKAHLPRVEAAFEPVMTLLGGASLRLVLAETPLAEQLGFNRRRPRAKA